MDTTQLSRPGGMFHSRLVGAVLIGGLFYLLGQYIASQPQRVQQEVAAEREISVQGYGEVQAAPNIAQVTLGVQTGAQPTAAAAMNLLAEKFSAVAKAVKGSDIDDKDIKTTNLSIQPVYDYRDGQQTLRGFEASESIEVKIRDLDRIGEVVAKSTAEGVNQVGGISFTIDDPTKLEQEAQAKAIANAEENAEQLAEELGVRLGRVKSFTSLPNAPDFPPPLYARAELAQGGDVAVPPVPAGSQDVTSTVTVTYELK